MSSSNKKVPTVPTIETDAYGNVTDESWAKLMNWHEDYNHYERMAITLAPELRRMEARAKELEKEADLEREERLRKLEEKED